MDTVVGALIAGISLVVGTVLGAVLEDRRARASEERRDQRESKERLVQSLDATRTMLDAQLAGLLALAVGDRKGITEAQRRARTRARGSLRLVGDDDVVRAYRALLIEFQHRLGKTVRAADRVRYVEVMGRVNDALDAQEQRVWKGAQLRKLSPPVEAELADIWSTASRMLLFDQPAGLDARIVRWVVDHLWRARL
jgi:hypothetical protein